MARRDCWLLLLLLLLNGPGSASAFVSMGGGVGSVVVGGVAGGARGGGRIAPTSTGVDAAWRKGASMRMSNTRAGERGLGRRLMWGRRSSSRPGPDQEAQQKPPQQRLAAPVRLTEDMMAKAPSRVAAQALHALLVEEAAGSGPQRPKSVGGRRALPVERRRRRRVQLSRSVRTAALGVLLTGSVMVCSPTVASANRIVNLEPKAPKSKPPPRTAVSSTVENDPHHQEEGGAEGGEEFHAELAGAPQKGGMFERVSDVERGWNKLDREDFDDTAIGVGAGLLSSFVCWRYIIRKYFESAQIMKKQRKRVRTSEEKKKEAEKAFLQDLKVEGSFDMDMISKLRERKEALVGPGDPWAKETRTYGGAEYRKKYKMADLTEEEKKAIEEEEAEAEAQGMTMEEFHKKKEKQKMKENLKAKKKRISMFDKKGKKKGKK